MSIAIYDYDFHKYLHVPLNLEVMKLSSYYKNKREIVSFVPNIIVDSYSKTIIRKDYEDGDYEGILFNDDRVEYGGLAFSNNRYMALPEEIELQSPDKTMYLKYETKFSSNNTYNEIFHTMLNSEHLRLSLDGKTVWKDFMKPINITKKTRCVFFHDYNLNAIENSYEAVRQIVDTMTSYRYLRGQIIGTKFPIQISDEENLLKWCGFNSSRFMFSIKYNNLLNNEFLNFLLNTFIGSEKGRRLYYNVTAGCKNEKDFFDNRLPIIYPQILLCRVLDEPIILTYNEDFFTTNTAKRLMQLLNNFCCSSNNLYAKIFLPHYKDYSIDYTLYRYITTKNFQKYMEKIGDYTNEELREIFMFVKEKNYEVFKMFYEWGKVELINNKIKPL